MNMIVSRCCGSKSGNGRKFLGRFVPTNYTCFRRRLKKNVPSLSFSKLQSRGGDDDMDMEDFSFTFDSFDKQGSWLTMDWDEALKSIPMPKSSPQDRNIDASTAPPPRIAFAPHQPSPVQVTLVRDRMVHIKRDDLLHLPHSNVSGNKARKMFALNQLLVEDINEDNDQFPNVLVSYGGPQSNAMLALAAIVNAKNINMRRDGTKEDIPNEIENDIWMTRDDTESDSDNDIDGVDGEKNMDGDETDTDSSDSDLDSGSLSIPISTGGSNDKKKRFVYYTKKIPRYLRKQPNGNFLRALSLGMELMEISNDEYKELFGGEEGGSATPPQDIDPPLPNKQSLWVPQGGACGMATPGAKVMAYEIVQYWMEKGKGMPLTVCVPGGTCTTAMLLSREVNKMVKQIMQDRDNEQNKDGTKKKNDFDLDLDIQVAVIPCVGDEEYAKRQMKALDLSTGGDGKSDIPLVFPPPNKNKGYLRFGEPSPAILETFLEMKDEYDLYLDLLYGAPAWNLLLYYFNRNIPSPIQGRQIMYVHSGGLEGISSQLTRYKHKGLVGANQIQQY